MKVIGLTGGIASGKTLVSTMLEELSARIIDADRVAKRLVAKDMPAWKAVKEKFGDSYLLPDEQIDRKKLAENVFKDEALRQKLNTIMFPVIRKEIEKELEALKKQGNIRVAVIDAALLIEAGWVDMVDEVWLVKIEPDLQAERLMARDGIYAVQAIERISSQMQQDAKMLYAHKVIDNSRTVEYTKEQVERLWKELC